MTMMTTTAKRHVLSAALLLAAGQYERDAEITEKAMAEPEMALARERISSQFLRQAAEARTLADAIEQADYIALME